MSMLLRFGKLCNVANSGTIELPCALEADKNAKNKFYEDHKSLEWINEKIPR